MLQYGKGKWQGWRFCLHVCELRYTHMNKTELYTAPRSWRFGWGLSVGGASQWRGRAQSGWTWPGRQESPGWERRRCDPHHTHRWCSVRAHLMCEVCGQDKNWETAQDKYRRLLWVFVTCIVCSRNGYVSYCMLLWCGYRNISISSYSLSVK